MCCCFGIKRCYVNRPANIRKPIYLDKYSVILKGWKSVEYTDGGVFVQLLI